MGGSGRLRARPSAEKMKAQFQALSLLALASLGIDGARAQPAGGANTPTPNYGSSAEHGLYVTVTGIKLYYESHGTGPVMLQVHGNSGSIADLTPLIRHFSKSHRVIVADSRGHGKSEFGQEPLTFERMAEDLNALLDQLGVKGVAVLGLSDGGILGLLLAIHHPDKVGKLVAGSANLEPSAAYDWALRWAGRQVTEIEKAMAQGNRSPALEQQRQRFHLLLKQPNIPISELKKVVAPTLIVAGDRDVIRSEHTQAMFDALPNAHLAIIPGTTHFAAFEAEDIFTRIVERFLTQPFKRPQTSDIFR